MQVAKKYQSKYNVLNHKYETIEKNSKLIKKKSNLLLNQIKSRRNLLDVFIIYVSLKNL